jgi:hypothetical protein
MDQLELRLRDFLCHNHSVIAKQSNAVANTQHLDKFLEVHAPLAKIYL